MPKFEVKIQHRRPTIGQKTKRSVHTVADAETALTTAVAAVTELGVTTNKIIAEVRKV